MSDVRDRFLVPALILIGVSLILVGYFSPWIPHPTAGLALTGFEIAEWIKFAPEVRSGASSLQRRDFYWPPIIAAIGLAVLAAGGRRWGWTNWLLIVLAALLSLFPFPLLEEIQGLTGIIANLGRIGLIALGMVIVGLAGWRRRFQSCVRGGTLVLSAGVGVTLVSTAFSAAEPIIERLANQLIDPTPGYNLVRSGMGLLILAGIVLFFRSTRPVPTMRRQ